MSDVSTVVTPRTGSDDLALLESLYRDVYLVRRFDEELVTLTRRGVIRGPMHTGRGQEAVGVGATAALGSEDLISATHRAHAYYIGRGLDLYGILAEMAGRPEGLCKGRAGHMLIADASRGMLGGSAIVGQSLLLGIGHGFALRHHGTEGICLVVTGDGATNSGAFNEAMNMIALWSLPVVVLVENNQYGLTVRLDRHVKNTRLVDRAAGYGIAGTQVDGNDAVAVREAVAAARAAALGGHPQLIEAVTYRLSGFSTSDIGGYQDVDTESTGYADCIEILAGRLDAAGADDDTCVRLRSSVDEQIAHVVDRLEVSQ